MLRYSWIAGLALAAACGGASDDEGLFGGGGSGGGGAGGAGGTAGGSSGSTATGGSGAAADAGLGGGPSGAGGGTSGSAGAGGGEDAGPDYTLENVCTKLPAELCALRKGCCEKSGVGFSQTDCEAREQESCKELTSQVSAGERTFDADKIPACLASFQPLYEACQFTGSQLISYLKSSNLCNGIFASKNGPGDECDQASDCAPSNDPNGYAGCGESSGQCYQATFAKLDEVCSEKLCGEGLACVYPPFNGTPSCQTQTAPGSPCNTSAQCGYGYYCPQVLGQETCKPAQPGGSFCTSDLHCLSLNCANGQCTEPAYYVDQNACGK